MKNGQKRKDDDDDDEEVYPLRTNRSSVGLDDLIEVKEDVKKGGGGGKRERRLIRAFR